MDFKYFIAAIIVCCSCEKQFRDNTPSNNNTGGSDTTFSINSCSTNGRLMVDSNGGFYVSGQMVNSGTIDDYNYYSYADLSSNFMVIYTKKQNTVPKKYKIIPYEEDYQFSSYHEAMIKVYMYWDGGYFFSTGGTLNLEDVYEAGFCKAQFIKVSDSKPVVMDFTY